ncbi:MAG: methyltransferase domain-containing protein [Myxococcales bacterium]|nr:methyltransferase domain-containing protein [Myxococcales bacterium]
MVLEGAQDRAFGHVDEAHYRWVTEHPYVAERERELTEAAFAPLGERVLDIGCGEGTTLHHLGAPPGAVGIDASEAKIAFCRAHVPGPRFEVGDAQNLAFADESFDHVIVRDVIHHLPDPPRFVAEAARVLVPGGRLDVLEPCAFNPLVALHGMLLPEERGELRSTPRYLEGLLAAGFDDLVVTKLCPMPLHRVVFHPRFGRPGWGDAERWVATAEQAMASLLPSTLWSYIHLRGFRRRR